jgi:hypothetical protein
VGRPIVDFLQEPGAGVEGNVQRKLETASKPARGLLPRVLRFRLAPPRHSLCCSHSRYLLSGQYACFGDLPHGKFGSNEREMAHEFVFELRWAISESTLLQ